MGDPEPQLDVSWVGPSTVLVINRQRTHGGLRSACLLSRNSSQGWADWLDSVAGLTGMAGSK